MTVGPSPAALRRLAEACAREAGLVALDGRRAFGSGLLPHDTKSSATDPVTEYDRAAEERIVTRLRSARPDDRIVGEEGAEHPGTSGLEWHVDPIDGTVNFLYGRNEWCTSVGVRGPSGYLAGAVYAPATDELYSAARGAGSTLNGEPIGVTETADLGLCLIATGFSYDPAARARQAARLTRILPTVRDIRRSGSAALDLCAVAAGRVDGYFEENLNSWDVTAGLLIAAEAGAACRGFEDAHQRSGKVLVTNPGIHAAVRALIDGDGPFEG